jgi:hypothetical protein
MTITDQYLANNREYAIRGFVFDVATGLLHEVK